MDSSANWLPNFQSLVGWRASLDPVDFFFFYDLVIKNQDNASEANKDLDCDDLVKAFMVFDLNGDGFISSEELQNVLSRLGLWDEQHGDCKSMNSDGMLDFEEFKQMMLLSDNA